MLGPFRLEKAISVEEAKGFAREGRLQDAMVSISDALGHMPAVAIRPDAEERFRNGVQLDERDFSPSEEIPSLEGKIRVLSATKGLIGVARLQNPGGAMRINAERVFIR